MYRYAVVSFVDPVRFIITHATCAIPIKLLENVLSHTAIAAIENTDMPRPTITEVTRRETMYRDES